MAERIPQELLDEIIAANDIVEIVSKYVTLKRSGSSFVGLCPFHREKTPSFSVVPDRQYCHCFGCGEGGNVISFIEKIEHLDFRDAVEMLAQNAGIKLEENGFSEQDRERYDKKQLIYRINKEAALFYRKMLFEDQGKTARGYILGRGFSPDMLTLFAMGYSPQGWSQLSDYLLSKGFKKDDIILAGLAKKNKYGGLYDFFRGRLMFPIIDTRSNVLGFSGRLLDAEAKERKYVNTGDTIVFNKSHNLYNLNYAKKYASQEIILVEGQMDAISLYQYGFKNAVAPLGTAFTEEQSRLLLRYASNVVICYDTDNAGRKATERAIEIFKGKDVKLKIMNLPEGKDPDEFLKKNGAKAFEEQLKDAKSVADYRISMLEKRYDIKTADGREGFANEAAKILASVPNAIERDVLTKTVADRTGISLNSIVAEVKKDARRNTRREKTEAVSESIKIIKNINRSQNARLIDSEQTLLSLCAKDKSILNHHTEILKDDFFSDRVHSQIAQIIAEGKIDIPLIALQFDEVDAKKVAAALTKNTDFENPEKAATDLINVIKQEKLNQLINKAMKEGNAEELNRLIMAKNKH
ncbi:MAG: DNA primase [Clostridia bacterium]|nr:DNA primase [Clostridia bacterium]